MTDKSTLLIVDDDKDIDTLIQRSLPLDHFNIFQAEDGESAIKLLQQLEPDLIILDVMLPGLDGFDTCRQIKQLDNNRYTPLIIMTSLNDMDSINKAYEAGATDFIVKPFNPTLLNHQIRFLLKSKQTADELRSTREQLETAQRIAKLGHWQWIFADNQIKWSHEISQILGFAGSMTSTNPVNLISRIYTEDKQRVKKAFKYSIRKCKPLELEYRSVTPDGIVRTVFLQAEVIGDEEGKAKKMVGTLQDISQRRKAEGKIKSLAYYNKVTGLPNRILLKRLLNKYIRNSQEKQPIAVLTLSLDRFKLITDSYGHGFGESLIRKVAIRLIRSIKDSSYFSIKNHVSIFQKKELVKALAIAHCDGDEFVIILPEIGEIDDAALIARNITNSVSNPFYISKQEIRITASIGISIYPIDGENTDQLLKNSATALYHAKRQGGDSYKFYTSQMNAKAFARLTLETSLRKAIDEKQFVLLYQPKVSLATQQLSGMESLIRWNHPELGLISPGYFINIVEKTGLIIPLGETIIELVCEQVKQWKVQGYKPVPVAINLSAVQLRQKDFHLRFANILKKSQVQPEMIELEITESTLMNNMEKAITMLKKLRLLGVKIALDDFGTGYSSLTYLKHFPVNTLKIDRSFIQNVAIDKDDASIVKGVIALAHSMQLTIVAEGIEDKSQVNFLKQTGCDFGQGYYYSKPTNAEIFTEQFMQKKVILFDSEYDQSLGKDAG